MFNRKTLLNRLGAHTTNSLTSTAWGSIPGGMVCGHRVKRECFLRIPRFLPTVTPQKPLRSVPSGDLLYIYIFGPFLLDLCPFLQGRMQVFYDSPNKLAAIQQLLTYNDTQVNQTMIQDSAAVTTHFSR